ncbi:MAG: enoyl-CoA hydratase/isomerase family protein [Planctomycetales bacterium]|nr:enoyl-CoA hydratase/isomerase family protein [Planctomycetales bacterium]
MTIQIKVHETSGTIIMDRPSTHNAADAQLVAALDQAFGDLHQEKRVRAVILTGKGTSFCAGTDLRSLDIAQSESLARWHGEVSAQRDLLVKMLHFPKPIIAAVNGPALGLGAALALAADICIGTEDATFGLPESRRGLTAGLAIPLLAFRIGAGVAARLGLLGESLSAAEAHRVQLYQELVPADQLWVRAHALSGVCGRGSAEAQAMAKRLLNETVGEDLQTWLSLGAAATATSRTTDAAAEGVHAFLEKRVPKWP